MAASRGPGTAPRATLLEPVEEIRQAVRASPPTSAVGGDHSPNLRAVPVGKPSGPPPLAPPSKVKAGKPPQPPEAARGSRTVAEPVPSTPDAVVFRPVNRPPMAVLVALDDGSRDQGELWRIRQSPFVVGRNSGDAIIPHDSEISGRHCQVACHVEGGVFRWHLTDLKSTNGTFLRVAKVPLRDGLQILIGSRRYEYRSMNPSAAAAEAAGEGPLSSGSATSTSKWQIPSAAAVQRLGDALVEILPEGDGRRYPLPTGEAILGTAGDCGVQIINDPFCSTRHAKLTGDEPGRRNLENLNSTNGLWVRIQEQRIDQNCEFQCGEQRFLVRFP